MNDPGSFSPGEAGGIFAGITVLLGLLGGGIKWLLGWKERREERLATADEKRAETRAAKLQVWHEELARREHELDARIETRLARLEGESNALRLAFGLVASQLRQIDPANAALAKAEQLLAAAFPLDPNIPPAMSAQLGAID